MIKKILATALLLAASQMAHAALFQYTYQGNQMASGINGFPDGIGGLTISFTVAQELDADRPYDSGAITPLSWQVFDGITTITDATPGFFIVDFDIGTSGGEINEWAIRIFREPSTVVGLDRIFSWNNPNNSVVDGSSYCLDFGGDDNCDGIATANVVGNPGSWSVTQVPVPPAILLFASALFAGARLRK